VSDEIVILHDGPGIAVVREPGRLVLDCVNGQTYTTAEWAAAVAAVPSAEEVTIRAV
jgi:hypothetical protein